MPQLVKAHLFLIWLLVSASAGTRSLPSSDQTQRVKLTARKLAKAYDPGTGLFLGTGWWNAANGITALTRVSQALHTTEFDSIYENTFTKAQEKHPAFINEFYDDEGWWALAWLDVYDLRRDARYLQMSESIFADMSNGWSDTCGGGIWWKKNEHYKNAIANELFLSVSVRLAEATTGSIQRKYLDWAHREERWFVQSGMINAQGLVNDGLDNKCSNNQKATWSYNQGVILTGLTGLSSFTGEAPAQLLANRIAHAATASLADMNGILHDPCEPNCGADGVQFKGILVRNLSSLDQKAQSAGLTTFLDRNAVSVWDHARTSDGTFSEVWTGPPRDGGTGSLISALDALTAPLYLRE